MTVTVTDHALVRWLERVEGLDIEKARAQIALLAEPAVSAGASGAMIGDVWFVLAGPKVITIMNERPPKNNTFNHDTGFRPPPERLGWQARLRRRHHK